MANRTRPNYFLLLEISPDGPWDQAVFERQRRVKRNDWSRKRLNGMATNPAVMAAQRALDLLPDIEHVMRDPARREQEAAAARTQLAHDLSVREAEFERDLQIMQAKGFIYDAEMAKLRNDYPEVVANQRISQQLDRVPVRPLAEHDAVPDRLDPSTARVIRGLLRSLEEESLYTLLAKTDRGVNATTELAALQRAAQLLYQRTQETMDKYRPGLAETHQLAGHAMHVFSSPEERARYDNTLALTPLDDLLQRYQAALGAAKRVDPAQVRTFLREAKDGGADHAVARTLLLKHFGNLKWTVVLPDTEIEAMDALARCPACRAPHDPDDGFCQVCGTRFQVTCPRCAGTVPGYGVCGQCGFPVGDEDWVRVLLEDCDELLRHEDLAGAEAKLREAGQAWPLKPNSGNELAAWHGRASERCRELRQQREAANQQISQRLITLMENRQYLAAHRLARAASASIPDRERILTESENHVREADRQYELAQRSGTDTHQKAELLKKALTECVDHEKSHRALRLLPPDPPRELRVVAAEDTVHLRWQPSPTEGVRYVVVRKRGAVPPTSAADGSRIATVVATSYDDASPELGMPVHYAVFADRGGTASQQCAATTDAVFLTGEVTVTSRRVDDGVVEIGWVPPAYATGTTITRSAASEKTDVAATEPNRLCDKGVRNGVTYTYTLRASFQDARGAVRLSRGTMVSLTPGPTPAPPRAVHVRTVEKNLGISFRHVDLLPSPVELGRVGVLWSRDRPPVQHGDRVQVMDLARYGSLLTEADLRGHALFDSGLYYFTSVVVHHELGYVGGLRRYAAVPEVGDLTATNQGDAVRLGWTWPDKCDAVLVAYDNAGWPDDPTVARHQLTVERDEYGRDGFDVVGKSGERDYFFVVAAVVRDGDEAFVSSGVRCRARLRARVMLEYDVSTARRRNRVTLRVSAPVRLPRLVIVGNSQKPPTNADDGEVLYEQDTVRVRKTHTIIFPATGKSRYARLFLQGGPDDVDLNVVHPTSLNRLRLH